MGSYISATEVWSVCQTESWSLIGYNPSRPITNKITKMMQIFVATLLLSRVEGSPVLVELQSQYPANPIEDPPTWAWGQHPDNGLGYKAKDNLEVEVCLANPHYINTAKCKLPLEVCLDNPQYLSSLGCSGHSLPREVCMANPSVLTSPSCAGNKYSLDVCLQYPEILGEPSCADNLTPPLCASNPSITLIPLCLDALEGYQPTLFQCQDNKEQLCSLNLCEKHEFIV